MSIVRVALIFLAAQLATPQPQRTGTASVEGVIVRSGTNEPISGVDLELTDVTPAGPPSGVANPPATPALFTARSGSDGKFAVRNVPGGTYKLVAARIGGLFVPVEYGQRGVLGRGVSFSLGEGQQMRDIRLEMAPVGTITGRVFDENARPVGHAAVLALSPMYREDQQIWNVMQIVHTDDRGEYRLFSLVPGIYRVAVRPEDPNRRSAVLNVVPPGRRGPYEQATSPVITKRILPTGETVEETYRFVYYGGSTDAARAVPLNLTPGGTLGAIDIPIAAGKVKSLHVRGRVIDGTNGNPAAGAAVRLIPRTFSAFMIVPTTTTDANGRFDLAGVSPGNYQLYFLGAQVPAARTPPGVPPPPPPPPLMTMTFVDVGNEDVENINVTINLGSTVAARAAIEGKQEGDPDLAKMRVVLESVPNGVAMVSLFTGQVTANGTVSIPNVWPADYRVLLQGMPANAYVKSIRLGQLDLLADVLRIPAQLSGQVEIVVGTDSATVEGRVVNDRQETASNVKVALVPDAPLRRRGDLYRTTATDKNGSFRLTAVAPGDYKVFAWEEAEDGAWRDPEFLRFDESRGKAVRVNALRNETVSVVVIPPRR
jgi:protocatechuate 3,4-dioxygenase beta subunit